MANSYYIKQIFSISEILVWFFVLLFFSFFGAVNVWFIFLKQRIHFSVFVNELHIRNLCIVFYGLREKRMNKML